MPYFTALTSRLVVFPGLQLSREVNVEPGLFEWLGWYIAGAPRFVSPSEFHDRGVTVNASYSPIWPIAKYNVQETTEQFYERSYQVTREILKKHEDEGWSTIYYHNM